MWLSTTPRSIGGQSDSCRCWKSYFADTNVAWGETYVKVIGDWKYLYRAVDKGGDTVDFLLTAKRDRAAAMRSLTFDFGVFRSKLIYFDVCWRC